jgi:excinuclease ABC subunit B
VLYADRMTGSMARAMAETERRRQKQLAYNAEHGITPQTIIKAIKDIRGELGLSVSTKDVKEILKLELTGETHDLKTVLKQKEEEMKESAKNLEFELAAILRDEISVLQKEIKQREKGEKTKDGIAKPKPPRRPARHGRTH